MKVENIVAPESDGPGLLKYYHICHTNHLLNIKSEVITLRDCKSMYKVQNV